MHVEFLVKDPTEIYACMIQVHKMASGIEGIVGSLSEAKVPAKAPMVAPKIRMPTHPVTTPP